MQRRELKCRVLQTNARRCEKVLETETRASYANHYAETELDIPISVICWTVGIERISM